MKDEVCFHQTEGIATLAINRSENQNMLSEGALEELDRRLLEQEGDFTVQVVVLTGKGNDYFCGGLFNPGLKGKLSFEQVRSLRRRAIELLARIENLMHPVIAAVNGRAQACGCELALARDMRVCASHAVFNLPDSA